MKKFPALHTISAILKVFAVILALFAIIAAVIIMAGVYKIPSQNAILTGIAVLIGGGFYVLMLWAAAEGILVILAIEENTRKPNKE